MSTLILLHKPFNVLCQFTDQQHRPTLTNFIDNDRVYPAGRLDYDSEGLVILTDDGRLQHQISHPKAKMIKTYWVQIEGIPSDQALEPLRQGVYLKDGQCQPAKVTLIKPPASLWPRTPPIRQRKNHPTTWIEITICEGRNRQVRRMSAAIGFPTLRLIRYKVGDWSIDNLKPGEYKTLTIHSPSK